MKYKVKYKIIVIIFLLIWDFTKSQTQDSIAGNNPSKAILDTIATDTIPQRNGFLDVVESTSDEQYQNAKERFTLLLKNAVVTYTDLKIEADYIKMMWDSGNIYAIGKKDSTGKIVEPSIFTQNGKKVEYNSFVYNVKTKKGKAFNVRTEESMGGDQGVVVAEIVRQYSDSVSGMKNVAYTTDEYFISKKDSVADYHLQTRVAKLIQGETRRVVTGPIVMKIYNVTTPLVLPFSYLPLGTDRSTGLLMPSFGERESVGFYIEGAGIYLPLGDYMDLSLTGDIYTKGSYGLHAVSQYKKRYKFLGNFRLDWEKRVTGIKGLPSYSTGKIYRVYWSHSQDTKANPNFRFAANVNFSSSKYYRNSINNLNSLNGDILTNTTSSSISLNKTWPGTPFSASMTLRHSQQMNASRDQANPVTLNLPQFTLNMNRIYPFAPRTGTKKGLFQNLNFSYNFNLSNTIYTNDEDFFSKKMFDNMKNGAEHVININTGTTIFNYFPLNFSAGYREVWSLKSLRRYYDNAQNKVIDEEVNGFNTFRVFNISTNTQTTLYGQLNFGTNEDNKLIKAIRHVITPSVGFSFTPDFSKDFWGYYSNYIDKEGNEIMYSRFSNGIYGGPSRGLSQSLNFSLDNNLELKVRSRNDSTSVKKIKIFDYLNINASYNFASDSMKLSPISMRGATRILDNKMTLNYGATINPYRMIVNNANPNGLLVNQIGGFTISNYNFNTSYSIGNTTFGERKMDFDRRGRVRQDVYYFDKNDYAQFLMPWNVNFGITHNVSRTGAGKTRKSTSLNLNGTISPTPYWRISANTNFDLQTGKVSYTTINFNRDLRSFNINFSMVPFGQYKTWNFFVGIKANFLSDALKYEERNFNTNLSDF